MTHTHFSDLQKLKTSVSSAILGKDAVIERVLIALIAQGHVLLEDVPGVGKTTLALSLARSIDGTFQRVQFTSDLLPSDVLGVTIFNSQTREFEFKPGPVFANVLLADEINRTTPKTQSALLEAMQDGAVTVDRLTHPLPTPFIVLATQNPIEFHGTYPLPESQLDRFLMKIPMGYPDAEAELQILKTKGERETALDVRPVLKATQIQEMQKDASKVAVESSIAEYIQKLVHVTRTHKDLELGVSTRGALALYRASQARAYVRGMEYVTPDDVKAMVIPVWSHRLIVSNRRMGAHTTRDSRTFSEGLLNEILSMVSVPI